MTDIINLNTYTDILNPNVNQGKLNTLFRCC